MDGGSYDEIDITLYTVGYRRICHQRHECHGEIERDLSWDLKDDCNKSVSNGLYYAVIEAHGREGTERFIDKVLILR